MSEQETIAAGKGAREAQQDYADDQEDTECPWCKGRGWNSSANGKAYCPDCEGTGRVPVVSMDEEN